jgi:predicted nucleic acid-binding protein
VIHLDTGFLIRALVRGSVQDSKLRAWLRQSQNLGMSTVAWTEFLCGPLTANQTQLAARVVAVREPLTEAHAQLAAVLFNRSGRRRGSLADCLIAATAIQAGAALATTNPRDFERFTPHGLQLHA